jgi:hypothetical protein
MANRLKANSATGADPKITSRFRLLGLLPLGFFLSQSIHYWRFGQFGNMLWMCNIGNLLTVSNIEAVRGTRLADLYLEQSLFEDVVNIRIGQFAADEEFLISDVAGEKAWADRLARILGEVEVVLRERQLIYS